MASSSVMTSYTDNQSVNELIHKYCQNKDIHSGLFVTFQNVFDKVWDRIQNPDKYEKYWINGIKPDTNDMLERFKQEMIDSKGMCFTGYLTRCVNSLVGFYSDINIQISSSDQISAKINIILEKSIGEDTETRKNKIRESLREIEVEDKVIEEWIENIPEFMSPE